MTLAFHEWRENGYDLVARGQHFIDISMARSRLPGKHSVTSTPLMRVALGGMAAYMTRKAKSLPTGGNIFAVHDRRMSDKIDIFDR